MLLLLDTRASASSEAENNDVDVAHFESSGYSFGGFMISVEYVMFHHRFYSLLSSCYEVIVPKYIQMANEPFSSLFSLFTLLSSGAPPFRVPSSDNDELSVRYAFVCRKEDFMFFSR